MPPTNMRLMDLIATVWNGLGTPLRRRLAWMANDRFIHGVSGIILDREGRVLLLKHRFWIEQRWGLPGGLARHGETPGATLRRELMEETGLDVRPMRLLRVNTTRGRLADPAGGMRWQARGEIGGNHGRAVLGSGRAARGLVAKPRHVARQALALIAKCRNGAGGVTGRGRQRGWSILPVCLIRRWIK
jgi:8-oxo-dGTP pyrophosphatase MutT (NUDIX family)